MTDQPTCDRCGQPTRDTTAYACDRCRDRLRADLKAVILVAGEAAVTIARLDQVERQGTGRPELEDTSCGCELCEKGRQDKADSALSPKPWPVDLGAGARHDGAVNQLITWVRHIVDTRGVPVPIVTGHPLAAAATFLGEQLDWLRHQPYAAEAFDVLAVASWTIVGVVDRPADQVLVGRCPCGEYLYARRGADQVRCKACGTTYNVEASRDELKRQLDQALFTAAEIATLVAYFGEGQREPIRKLINQWHARGLIAVHDYQGESAYRFGEVVSRLASSRRAS